MFRRIRNAINDLLISSKHDDVLRARFPNATDDQIRQARAILTDVPWLSGTNSAERAAISANNADRIMRLMTER